MSDRKNNTSADRLFQSYHCNCRASKPYKVLKENQERNAYSYTGQLYHLYTAQSFYK